MTALYPGHEPWFTRDYSGKGKALSLNKKSMGEFLYHLLRMDGQLTNISALNAKYDDSYVQAAISLPKGKREEFEKLSGVTLEEPSYLTPASTGSGFSL